MTQTNHLPTLQTRIRANYFSNRLDAALTIGFGAIVLWVVWSLADWGVFHAVWFEESRELCGHGSEGACWAVVDARWRLILFGLYPFEEQWRSATACVIIVIVGILSCMPFFWSGRRLAVLWIAGFATFYVLMRGGVFGLTPVFEQYWGGLSLTIFIFASVTLLGMPLAIIFALLRRSNLPWIRITMGVVIDTVRSLPLLSIMFTFAIVLPFVLPGWMITDKLYRVIVGYAIFFACYQAEIIRSGLQALPAGQEEAAKALGMGYWHRIGYILLPQAFRNALPPTINQLVITFKETSLVAVIGFFEILASGNVAYGTSEWNFAHVEVYCFVGLVYFVFVFALSRYGAYLENRMAVTER